MQQKQIKQYNNNSGVDFFVMCLIITAHRKKKRIVIVIIDIETMKKIESKFDQMLKRSLGKSTIFDMEQLQ